MAKKPNPDEAEPPFLDVPTEPESPAPVESPLKIVDIEEATEVLANPEAAGGKRFFIGHVGVLKFDDGGTYHVRDRHVLTSDPKLIENLTKLAKNPSNHIFPEE